MSQDMNALRDYIVYESGGQARGESTVLLHVTHSNLKARMFEIRLDKHMTVERVKEKLRSHTGTGSLFMHLTMLDFNGQVRARTMHTPQRAVLARWPVARVGARVDRGAVRSVWRVGDSGGGGHDQRRAQARLLLAYGRLEYAPRLGCGRATRTLSQPEPPATHYTWFALFSLPL